MGEEPSLLLSELSLGLPCWAPLRPLFTSMAAALGLLALRLEERSAANNIITIMMMYIYILDEVLVGVVMGVVNDDVVM